MYTDMDEGRYTLTDWLSDHPLAFITISGIALFLGLPWLNRMPNMYFLIEPIVVACRDYILWAAGT